MSDLFQAAGIAPHAPAPLADRIVNQAAMLAQLFARQIDDVADHLGLLELGGDPQLSHLAATGDQQFANCLAALDLLVAAYPG